MIDINQTERQITIKSNPYFYVLTVGVLVFVFFGIELIISLFPFEEGYTASDVFGAVFVFLWLSGVLWMGITVLKDCTKKVIIDNEGVFCKTLFKKSKLLWSEVADWGLSYCGQTRGEGDIYHLYFSVMEQKTKNKHSKKLKGEVIKTYIIGDDYGIALESILPFCSSRTAIEPFIGEA